MSKEGSPNKIPQPDLRAGRHVTPFVLPKGELSKNFRVLTSSEVKKLGLTETKPKTPEKKIEGEVSLEKAKEILGKDMLGPEAVNVTFGFSPENVPSIPFSVEELERAKELNQFLELRINRIADGKPLDMRKMHELLQPEFTTNRYGKILNSYGQNDSWYKSEDLLKDVPRASWVLVSKDVVPNSLSKNFLQQTQVLAEYLTTDIFRNQPLPEVYQKAIEEFEAKKAGIQAILTNDWQEAARQLAELQINQLTRQLPVEAVYDFLMYFKNNNKRLLESHRTWTVRRASGGGLVNVGRFDADGARVGRWSPRNSNELLGVSFSRSL